MSVNEEFFYYCVYWQIHGSVFKIICSPQIHDLNILVWIYIFSLIQSNRSQIIVKNEIPRKSEMTPPSWYTNPGVSYTVISSLMVFL